LDHFNDSLASISAERLPIATIIPRAWIGFRKAPWSFIGLTALMLCCLMGLGVVARDLQLSSNRLLQYTGDFVLVMAALVPLAPLLALLQLADEHLPGGLDRNPEQPMARRRFLWLLKQTCGLTVLEVLIGIGGISSIRLLSQFLAPHSGVLASLVVVLGGVAIAIWLVGQLLSIPLLIHHGYRPLRAMEHSRKLVQANRLKVMALIGLLLGINLLGLMAASLGLLFSVPFSALLLMASCRTQTSWRRESRRNMLPT
jgi:hypothetical protein